jgi:hypothetical protein
MKISHFGWAALDQLVQGPVRDGDLVSKTGRSELIGLGLAQRARTDERGFAINELTPQGFAMYAQPARDAFDRAVAAHLRATNRLQ